MNKPRSLVLNCLIGVFAATFVMGASQAQAQPADGPVEVGAQVNILRLGELDITDVGVGLTGAWHIMPRLAIDGTLSWFPGDGDAPDRAKTQQRTLGLIGVRSGITRGRVDFFGRARVGVLRFAEQDAVACIRIFPEPLECQLASGYTAFATDLGGDVIARIDDAGRWRVRFDIGDLLVRYDREALRPNGERTEGFISHNLLTSVGLVWRF